MVTETLASIQASRTPSPPIVRTSQTHSLLQTPVWSSSELTLLEPLEWPLSPSVVTTRPSYMSPVEATPVFPLTRPSLPSPSMATSEFLTTGTSPLSPAVSPSAVSMATQTVTLVTPQLQIAQWVKDLMSLEGDMPILTEKENNEKGGTARFDVWNHFHSAFQLLGEQEEAMVAGNVVEPDQGCVPTAQVPADQGHVSPAQVPADQGQVLLAQLPANQGHVSPAQVPADQGQVLLAQLPANQGQAATTGLPVDKEVVPTIERSQESFLATENLQGTDVEVDDETEVSVELESEVVNRTEVSVDYETEAEDSEVQDKENRQVQEGESQGEQIDLPTTTETVATQAETTETNLKMLDQTTKDNPQRQGEYLEEEIKFEESSENGPEGGV